MANADFNPKQTGTPGGFDAGSYREKASPEQAVQLTPLQQKLAGLEAKLPAALTRQAVALALSIVVMLAAFAGFGSAKVRSKYNTARQWFTVGVSADNGYNLSEELTARANTAANVITTAGNTLGADNAEVQTAQAALDDFSACLDAVQSGGKSQALTSLSYYNGSSMHALYQANETLGKAIDQLYAKLQEQAADPMKMGAVQGQYGQFNSAGTIIGTLKYNEAVYNYRNEVGGFPANVLGGPVPGLCGHGQPALAAQRPVCGGRCQCPEQQHRADHHRPERPTGKQLQRGADRRADGGLHRQLHHRGICPAGGQCLGHWFFYRQ